MKKSTLSLSLLIGATLTIPSLAMAAPADTAAAGNAAIPTTLEAEDSNTNNEVTADQSNSFQISETQKVSRAKVNNSVSQQPMTTELQAEQVAVQETMQNPEQAVQQQDLQQAMLDEEAALQQEAELQEEVLLETQEDAEPTETL